MIASGLKQIDVYENDSLVPVAKVLYTDTPYGVPSLGYCVEYYNNPSGSLEFTFDESDLVLRGNDNILCYDWSFGVPAGISSIYFKAQYYGYFYAKFTGNYRFLVSTDPSNKVRFYMDAVTPDGIKASNVFDSPGYLRIENLTSNGAAWTLGDIGSNETWYITVSLQGGQWYSWGLQFINGQENANLALRYIEPPSVLAVDDDYPSDHDPLYRSGHGGYWGWISTDEPVYHTEKVCIQKIMSAGITNYRPEWTSDAQASFEAASEIKSVLKIDGSHDINKSSVFNFTVPLNNDSITNEDAIGFKLNNDTGLYYEQASNISLRHGRKISIYLGYQSKCSYADGECNHSNVHINQYYKSVCDSGGNVLCPANTPLDTDYIKCFEGIITDISPSVNKNDNILSISCQDQMLFMLNAINENYPNNISYAISDFISDRKSKQPNGLTRPTAYDSWPLSTMIRDLCIKASIDPVWLYGRKQLINANGNIVYGNYLINDQGLILKRKSKYGNPLSSDKVETDDEYIWSYNFGDTLHSMASKAIDMYGYIFKINQDGFVQCSPINSPIIHVPDWTYDNECIVHNTWTTNNYWLPKVDSRADGGRYYECAIPNVALKKTLCGSKFQVGIIKEQATSWHNIYQHQNLSESENIRIGLYDYIVSGSGNPISGVSVYETLRSSMHIFDVNSNIKIQNMYIMLKFMEGVTKFQDGIEHPAKHNNIDIQWTLYRIPNTGCLTSKTAQVLFENSQSDFVLYETGTLNLPSAPYDFMENYKITIPFTVPPTFTSGTYYALKLEQIDNNPSSGPSIDGQVWDCFSAINTKQQNTPVTTLPTIITKEIYYIDGVVNNTSYTKTRFSLPLYFDIFCDAAGEFDGQHTTCRIDIFRENTGEHVVTVAESNIYNGATNHSDGLRFPEDGMDFSGNNPCIINIPSALLQSGDYNGIPLVYDEYRFEIIHSGDNGDIPTRITSIRSYEEDIYTPAYHFDTWRNIQKLSADFSTEDVRNDVIVIGGLKGKVESIDGDIINRNNPTYDYVYSRSTDLSSIYFHNTKNNIGRKIPFVVFEGTVSEQKHADWLSSAILTRYRISHNVPSWETVGFTFIEPYDTVYIKDLANNIMRDDEVQWVVSCRHNFERGKYIATYSSTPYEPWSSYTPRPSVNIQDFLGPDGRPQAFVNIKMTTTMGDYCGFNKDGYRRLNVYEVEESGHRLKITYDQIIDGFINVKIFKKGVSSPVAWLVGYVDDTGFEKDEYRERGYNYELYWDCTDETAASKMDYYLASGEEWKYIDNFRTEQGLYATSGDYYVVFELTPIEQNEGLDEESDRYKVSTINLPSNLNPDGLELIGGNSGTDAYKQYWSIMWGDTVKTDMSVTRPLEDGTWEDCTYHYNTPGGEYGLMFGVNNDTEGIRIKFDSENTNPRLLYFKVDAQVIRGTALRSPKLKPYVYEYVKAMWHSYILTKSSMRTTIHPAANDRDLVKNTPITEYNDFVTYYDQWLFQIAHRYHYYEFETRNYTSNNEYPIYIKLHSWGSYGNRLLAQAYYTTLRNLTINGQFEENRESIACFDKYAKFDDSENYITFWSQDVMPYENLEVEYIQPFARKITSHTPVQIAYNPGRIIQNQVDFTKIPLMEDYRLDAFRQVLATMIWIATLNQKALSTLPQYNPHQKWDWSKSTWIDRDDEKPTILVANYTQPIIRIWDKTGRYIDSNYRVYNGPLTHTHKYLTNCTNPGEHYISENNHRNGEGQSTATYFSSRLETSNIEHTHPELIYQCWLPPKQNYNATIAKEFAVNMEDWNTSLFGAYTKDGDCWWSYYTNGGILRDVKPLPFNTVLLNIPNYNMYDMTIQGNGIHNNWGIGFVNNDLVNVPCGAFTWHGYMYLKPGMAGQNVLRNIPFDISNIPNTGHWRTYASDETNWPGKNITHTRFACAAQPDNEEYSVVLAYKDMCLRIHWWYYYEYGGFYGPTSPHSVNNRWAYDSWLTMYTNGNYDISDFHIHFPIVETMPYDNMSWSWYMAVDDNKKILQDKYDSFFPGETDGDIMVLLTKLESSHGDGSEITYIGRPMRFNADDTEYYKRREGTGSRRPIPQNHSTNYPNKQSTNDVGGYHYAWYRNNDIQIPDWEVPEDLSTWEEIPHVMNFGITWGF